MNILKHAVLGGVAAVFALAAGPVPAADLPAGVEAQIKQAQEEGASAKESRRVARYAYQNGGEAEALQAMESYRKMVKEGVEDREAGKAVMKTVRARVRTGETGGNKSLQARNEAGAGEGSGEQVRKQAGDGEGSGEQVRKEAETGDGSGEQVRTRTREENGGQDAVSNGDAEKRVEKQLAEKKQNRLREQEKARQRDEESRMEERRNRFQKRGDAKSGSGDSGSKGKN